VPDKPRKAHEPAIRRAESIDLARRIGTANAARELGIPGARLSSRMKAAGASSLSAAVPVPCAGCSDPFVPVNSKQKYCCRTCSPLHRKTTTAGREKARAAAKKAYTNRRQAAGFPKPKACAQCHAPFQARSDRNRFCSAACRTKYKHWRGSAPPEITNKTCEWCYAPFRPASQKQALPLKRFCSEKCRSKAADQRKNAARPKIMLARTCPHCRTQFKTRHPNHRFCTNTCANKHRYNEERAHRDTPILTERTCKNCGTKFKVRPTNTHRQHCSRTCGSQWSNKKAMHRYYTNLEYNTNARAKSQLYKAMQRAMAP
jgi:hypothetical protein